MVNLYIPYIKSEITDEYIIYVFEFLNLGKVNEIEMINNTLKKDNRIYSAYLNIDLYNTEEANNFNYKINNNENIRIYYKKKSYWIIKKEDINENKYINPYICYGKDNSKDSLLPLPLSNTKNIFSSSNKINFEEMVNTDIFKNVTLSTIKVVDNKLKKQINCE